MPQKRQAVKAARKLLRPATVEPTLAKRLFNQGFHERQVNIFLKRYPKALRFKDDFQSIASLALTEAERLYKPGQGTPEAFAQVILQRRMTEEKRRLFGRTVRDPFASGSGAQQGRVLAGQPSVSLDAPLREGGELTLGGQLASRQRSPLEEVLERERLAAFEEQIQRIRNAVSGPPARLGGKQTRGALRLSQREQQVVALVLEGKKRPEIMEALGMAGGTADVTKRNALIKLKKILGDSAAVALAAVFLGEEAEAGAAQITLHVLMQAKKQGLSSLQLAERLGVHQNTVINRSRKFNLHLGNPDQAVKAARKFLRPVGKKPLTQKLLTSFVRQGKNARQISEETGHGLSTVYAHIKELGLLTRPAAAGQRGPLARPYTGKLGFAELEILIDKGRNTGQIAADIGVSTTTVQKAAKTHGLSLSQRRITTRLQTTTRKQVRNDVLSKSLDEDLNLRRASENGLDHTDVAKFLGLAPAWMKRRANQLGIVFEVNPAFIKNTRGSTKGFKARPGMALSSGPSSLGTTSSANLVRASRQAGEAGIFEGGSFDTLKRIDPSWGPSSDDLVPGTKLRIGGKDTVSVTATPQQDIGLQLSRKQALELAAAELPPAEAESVLHALRQDDFSKLQVGTLRKLQGILREKGIAGAFGLGGVAVLGSQGEAKAMPLDPPGLQPVLSHEPVLSPLIEHAPKPQGWLATSQKSLRSAGRALKEFAALPTKDNPVASLQRFLAAADAGVEALQPAWGLVENLGRQTLASVAASLDPSEERKQRFRLNMGRMGDVSGEARPTTGSEGWDLVSDVMVGLVPIGGSKVKGLKKVVSRARKMVKAKLNPPASAAPPKPIAPPPKPPPVDPEIRRFYEHLLGSEYRD